MKMIATLPLASLLALASCDPPVETDGDVCDEAASRLEACGLVPPERPAEGCVGDYQKAAVELVESGCDASVGGKADGFWCQPATRWTGLCEEVPLPTAAALVSIEEVCGDTEGRGPLCDALSRADTIAARATVAERLATEEREAVLTDPAVRVYLRERVMSLFVFHVAETLHGTMDDGASIDAILSEHFPAYDPARFAMAHQLVAPEVPRCDAPTGAVVFFPGVVRFLDRAEFAEQRAAIEDALPCVRTYLVDTGSFVAPRVNAERARATVDAVDADLGPVALHLLGYSQGSTNALQTLVQYPEIAQRTESLMVMNAAAHGSEVADTLGALLGPTGCEGVHPIARPTCAWAADQSPIPSDFVLEALAIALGIPLEQLRAFVEAEDGVAPAPDLRAFFERHLQGVESLTTDYARRFWSTDAQRLPRGALYYSFRSAISDTSENLPPSNVLFHALLERAGERVPYNDMQVRLENQALGGPVADLEVVGPVAEGNHWQWELATGVVPEHVMPARMTDRIPHREIVVAYFEALAEVGLLGPPTR